MNIFVAKWPNGTISIVTADTNRHLYNILDTEGDPIEAKIYKLKTDENGQFSLTTDIVNNKIKVGINLESDSKLKLCNNIFDNLEYAVQF